MRPLNLLTWTAAYWALYLPVSVVLKRQSPQGSWLGIILIGLAFTIVLLAYLTIRFREENQTEVPNYAKETEESTHPAPSGVEPAPKLRTDVDVDQLDADDDDNIS